MSGDLSKLLLSFVLVSGETMSTMSTIDHSFEQEVNNCVLSMKNVISDIWVVVDGEKVGVDVIAVKKKTAIKPPK